LQDVTETRVWFHILSTVPACSLCNAGVYCACQVSFPTEADMKQQWQALAKWSAIALCCVAGVSYAGNEQGRERGRGMGGPGEGFMVEAIDACEGKQAGAAVSLTGPGGQTLEAVCTLRPAVLLAMPKQHLERQAQAKAACAGLNEGASAVLSTPDGRNIAAQCQSRDGELVAVPTERARKR
jgi:hypothetical protein